MLVSDTGCCAQKTMKHSKKQGASCERTLPKATDDSDIYEKLGVSSLKQLQQFVAILNSGVNSVPDDGTPGKGC